MGSFVVFEINTAGARYEGGYLPAFVMAVETVLRGYHNQGRHGKMFKTPVHPVTAELPDGHAQPCRFCSVKIAAIDAIHLRISPDINDEGPHIPFY